MPNEIPGRQLNSKALNSSRRLVAARQNDAHDNAMHCFAPVYNNIFDASALANICPGKPEQGALHVNDSIAHYIFNIPLAHEPPSESYQIGSPRYM